MSLSGKIQLRANESPKCLKGEIVGWALWCSRKAPPEASVPKVVSSYFHCDEWLCACIFALLSYGLTGEIGREYVQESTPIHWCTPNTPSPQTQRYTIKAEAGQD